MVGIFLCLIVFVGLAVLIKSNLQHIVSEQKTQELKLQNERREEREREHQRELAVARKSSSDDAVVEKTPSEPSPSPSSSPTPTPSSSPTPPVPGGFQKVEEAEAGVSFNLPEQWKREESTNPKGERYLTYVSPDKEATIIFWCKLDPENLFVSTTEETIRGLAQKGYETPSSEATAIGGASCTRWTYTDGRTLSINRVFRYGDKSYSLLYRMPKARFTEWEAKLDEVRTSFRFTTSAHSQHSE